MLSAKAPIRSKPILFSSPTVAAVMHWRMGLGPVQRCVGRRLGVGVIGHVLAAVDRVGVNLKAVDIRSADKIQHAVCDDRDSFLPVRRRPEKRSIFSLDGGDRVIRAAQIHNTVRERGRELQVAMLKCDVINMCAMRVGSEKKRLPCVVDTAVTDSEGDTRSIHGRPQKISGYCDLSLCTLVVL